MTIQQELLHLNFAATVSGPVCLLGNLPPVRQKPMTLYQTSLNAQFA